jgi:hypothetical protein
MKTTVPEQLYNLSDRARTILRSAAKVESDERNFISICQLYLPGISDDEARELKHMLRAEIG